MSHPTASVSATTSPPIPPLRLQKQLHAATPMEAPWEVPYPLASWSMAQDLSDFWQKPLVKIHHA
jgi:hypothetical protein